MSRTPHPKAPGIAVGITEEMIRGLVHRFYADVRRDPMLGAIFNERVHDWDEHLEKLCAFWSSVVLMTGRYKGRPMPVHMAIPEISADHFRRWLDLFRATASAVCPETAAAVFIEKAEKIAQSLHLGISLHRGDGPVVSPLNF